MIRGNPDVLSRRYATDPINDIFSDRTKIICERELWIAVMKSQKELGVNIPGEDIEKFEAAKDKDIDPEAIESREKEIRHDVKAKIEAFVKAAGAGEYIHKGMTSRDLTDNVEQMQNRKAAELIFGSYISVLRHFTDKAQEYSDIYLTARTHHQAAQPTCLGRRFSMWAEELIQNLNDFRAFIDNYPLRGIKGPVGTQADMLNMLKSPEKVDALEKRVAELLGFKQLITSPGQIYPRSLDTKLVDQLVGASEACSNFAQSMRLMAGYDLVTEGFKEGQVGSSAMPHKMNTRSSERVRGLCQVLKGYQDMASRISGDQWEEGDVSCSSPRRVFLSGSFYTSDGICETTLTILNEMGAYPVMIEKEVDRFLPFMATTQLLKLATDHGIGRETAHEIIRKYSVAEALRMRNTGECENHLAESLAGDISFQKAGITIGDTDSILTERAKFIGNAKRQISQVVETAKALTSKYDKQAAYEPQPIL